MPPKRPQASVSTGLTAEAWFTPGRFALLLGVLIVVTFPQVVFGLETFFARDFGLFAYPLAYFQRESFWQGELPMWNPLNYCGLPFLAQWNTLTLYPPALLYLIFPLSWALGMFCLAHLFFAGLGMYHLAYHWTRNRLAASVAGTVFAFNGLTWCALMWPNNIAALGWMPWVVLAMERAWQSGGRQTLLAVAAGAAQMLTGAPEVILLTWLVVAGLGATHYFRGEIPKRRVLRTGVVVPLLVAGSAAVQLLPFLDLLAHSGRDVGSASAYYTAHWDMPRTGWANYLVPLFHSSAQANSIFFQHNQYWTSSYFLGVGVILLALASLRPAARNWRTWLLIGLAVFSLVLAMGDGGALYPLLKKIFPPLGSMRYPVKFVVLATFIMPLLAAEGLSHVQSRSAAEWAETKKWLLHTAVVLLVLIAAITCWSWLQPTPKEQPANTTLNAFVRVVFLAAIPALLVSLRGAVEFKLGLLLRVGLLVLFWLDVLTHAPNLSPTVARGVYQPGLIRQKFGWENKLQHGQARAMQDTNSLYQMTYQSVGQAEEDLLGRRLALTANDNLLDAIPKFDGFYSLEPRDMHALVLRVYAATNEMKGLKDFLGISHISNPTNAVDWTNRNTFIPLVSTGQQPVFSWDDDALEGITSDKFDPLQSVYLPDESPSSVSVTQGASAKVISSKFSAHRVDAEIEASAPSLVVLAQTYYHWWRAYVDGQPVKLMRANAAFQALQVPAGRHQIRLAYEDKSFSVGLGISLATLAGCLVAWFRRPKAAAGAGTVKVAPKAS